MNSLVIFCNLIPALLVIYYTIDGYSKGFLFMLVSLVRLIGAYYLARFLSDLGANFLMSIPAVRSQIENVALNQETAISGVPGGTLLLTGSTIESSVETIAWWLLYAICFAVIFGLLMVFFAGLLKLSKLFNKIPFLGSVNRAFGALEGLLFGLAFTLLLVYLVALLLNFFGYPAVSQGLLNSWITQAFRLVAGRIQA